MRSLNPLMSVHAEVKITQVSDSSVFRGPLRGRGTKVFLLALAMAAGGYARNAVGPLQEAMRMALAMSDNQIAMLQGLAITLPLVIVSVPLGLVIDRYSRVHLLLALTALNLLGNMLTVMAPSFAMLFAARCMVGLGGYATVPIVMSLLADLYAPAQRGWATMVISVGQVAGNSAAFALGGAVLAMLRPGPTSWRWTLLLLSAPLTLVTASMLAMREPQRTGVTIENPSVREAFAELSRYGALIGPLTVGLVMVEIAIGADMVWAAPIFARNFALPPDRVGTIMGMGLMVSGLLGPVIGGTSADLCQRLAGPRRTLFVLSALALLSAPTGLFAVMPGVASASTLFVIAMSMTLATAVMAMTLFTVVIPNELRGLCMSMSLAVNVLFVGLAPLLVSYLSGMTGGPSMIGKALALVCVATNLIAAAAFAFGIQHFPRIAVAANPSTEGEINHFSKPPTSSIPGRDQT
jgi:predicted MFS family arabinose efflux permease